MCRSDCYLFLSIPQRVGLHNWSVLPRAISSLLCLSAETGGCVSSACNDGVGRVVTGIERQAVAGEVRRLGHEASSVDALLLPGGPAGSWNEK